MRIAALSDLHAGTDHRGGLFGRSEAWLLEVLDLIAAEHDLIVFVGDLFETDAHPFWGLQRAQVRRLRRRYPTLFEHIRAGRYKMVFGNHDRVLGRMYAIPESFVIEASELRLLFVHGHQVDPAYKHLPFIEYTGHWSGAWLRRLHVKPAVWALCRIEKLANHVLAPANEPYCQRWARVLLESGEADVVVMGHSHREVLLETPHGIYANGGGCVEPKFGVVSIDTEQRTVKLLRQVDRMRLVVEARVAIVSNRHRTSLPVAHGSYSLERELTPTRCTPRTPRSSFPSGTPHS